MISSTNTRISAGVRTVSITWCIRGITPSSNMSASTMRGWRSACDDVSLASPFQFHPARFCFAQCAWPGPALAAVAAAVVGIGQFCPGQRAAAGGLCAQLYRRSGDHHAGVAVLVQPAAPGRGSAVAHAQTGPGAGAVWSYGTDPVPGDDGPDLCRSVPLGLQPATDDCADRADHTGAVVAAQRIGRSDAGAWHAGLRAAPQSLGKLLGLPDRSAAGRLLPGRRRCVLHPRSLAPVAAGLGRADIFKLNHDTEVNDGVVAIAAPALRRRGGRFDVFTLGLSAAGVCAGLFRCRCQRVRR
ncbi:hypothetical protein EMIT0P265_10256 [Pseudomonas zeae]